MENEVMNALDRAVEKQVANKGKSTFAESAITVSIDPEHLVSTLKVVPKLANVLANGGTVEEPAFILGLVTGIELEKKRQEEFDKLMEI